MYFQTAFSNEQSALYLRTLTDETPWEARNIILFGKEVPQPRLACWYGDLGYSYSGITLGPRQMTPTLVEIEDLNSSFVQDEIFGPFIVIERFNSSDEAIERANATRFGLAASVWGENREHARKLASKLKSGTVWLNCHNRLFAEAETGGYRESGYGRLHGLQGLEDFMSTKHVYWEDH